MSPELRALMRTDFPSFLMKCFAFLHPNAPPLSMAWYIEAICHHLVEASEGRRPRLVITVPPRHLKSIAAAVALCAWLLGRNPSLRLMVASYSQDLARLHAEQCRSIMESDWYQALFATRIGEGSNRQLEFITTAGGGRKAVSVGSSVTGFGADIIIVDDCMKADEAGSEAVRSALMQWFDGVLSTRFNDKATGRIISIQQRLHEDDLPAYLLEKGYYHLNLPAIGEREMIIPIGHGRVHQRRVNDLLNPEREDQVVLDRLRRELGPMVFEAQYQQNPSVPEGNLIRLQWFGSYDGETTRSWFHKVVQSWDTAATANPTSDWSVCTTWGYREGFWYLLDVFRQRLDYPDLKKAVIRLEHQWQPEMVLVERANTGISLVQELRLDGRRKVHATKPWADKQTRLIAQTAELESGEFLLPAQAPWLDTFQAELRAFPNSRYDDQVDSLSQFVQFQKVRYQWVAEERTPSGRLLRPVRTRSRAEQRGRRG